MNDIVVDIAVALEIFGTITGDDVFTADIGGAPSYPAYEGATEITPDDNEQTLQTAGRYIPGNIVVARIPQTEYAHITYDMTKNIRVW